MQLTFLDLFSMFFLIQRASSSWPRSTCSYHCCTCLSVGMMLRCLTQRSSRWAINCSFLILIFNVDHITSLASNLVLWLARKMISWFVFFTAITILSIIIVNCTRFNLVLTRENLSSPHQDHLLPLSFKVTIGWLRKPRKYISSSMFTFMFHSLPSPTISTLSLSFQFFCL